MRKQRHLEDDVTLASDDAGTDPVCPLCDRPIPADVEQSRHHLIPKAKGGRNTETVLLHHICHKTIHRVLKESELARNFNTVEALRAHPELGKFFEWVGKRPPGFLGKAR